MPLNQKLFAIIFVVASLGAGTLVRAQQMLDVPCPNAEPCQVIVLTETEVKVLVQENGILATAAQARSLDLGQFVSYFRQKIALAPMGKNVPKVEEKKPEEAKK